MKTVQSPEFRGRNKKLSTLNSQLRTYWPAVKRLCEQARAFYERDWMLGTSGNLSIKVSDEPLTIAVTASARPKGALTARDIVLVDERAHTLSAGNGSAKPSAETLIHVALYQTLPDCGAVFHVHTVQSTALTARIRGNSMRHFRIKRLEMLKGFNLWEQEASARLPVFPNWLDISRIARDIRAYVRCTPPALPALLIANHGLTAWGRDAVEAKKHVELTEFLCQYLWMTSAKPLLQ